MWFIFFKFFSREYINLRGDEIEWIELWVFF